MKKYFNNNKGFAITGIIYGLMVIFVFILSSFLAVVVGKNKRSEELLKSVYEDIEVDVVNVYSNKTEKESVEKFNDDLKYKTTKRAKYIFYSDLDEGKSCGEVYLPKGIEIEINADGKAVYNSNETIGSCSYTVENEDYWDINIINISVNGTTSNTGIPKSGLYNMTSNCSNLSYNPFTKELKIKGGNIPVICNANFTPYSDSGGTGGTGGTSSSYPLLNTMKVGDYVEYVGKNGCSGSSCKGYNAYQGDDDSHYTYGSCHSQGISHGYKYYVYGWRIAYIKDGNVYLVSAGSPECITLTSTTSSNKLLVLLEDLNTAALKYCNPDYVDGGTCSNDNARAMGNEDFREITYAISGTYSNLTSYYGSPDCYGESSLKKCGYNNDLLDNGDYYFFAAQVDETDATRVIWYPNTRSVFGSSDTDPHYGFRAIIKLSSEVYVTGGLGTMDEPFTIGK